jgi:hypothetical protein
MLSYNLAALEVEVLDGEEVEEGEEGDDGEVEAGDELEVAVLQAQVALQELPHRLLPEPRHADQLRPVAELREHQPVHRPRRRVRPVHPPPPNRDHLHPVPIIRTYTWISIILYLLLLVQIKVNPQPTNQLAYLPRDDEAGEDVPEDEDEERQPHGDLDVGRQGHRHHPQQRVVHEAHRHVQHEPEELGRQQLEPDHGVHDRAEHQHLRQHVR